MGYAPTKSYMYDLACSGAQLLQTNGVFTSWVPVLTLEAGSFPLMSGSYDAGVIFWQDDSPYAADSAGKIDLR
jgi:hypothetical protein